MRFLVIRSGSGWGGIVSRYIIDTEEQVKIDLDKHFATTGEDVFYLNTILDQIEKSVDIIILGKSIKSEMEEVSSTSIFKRPISSFSDDSKSNINLSMIDIEWFESNMNTCELDTGGMPVFDMQCDSVFTLIHDKVVQVLGSMYPQIWIKDEKLRCILNKITRIDPMYETLIT